MCGEEGRKMVVVRQRKYASVRVREGREGKAREWQSEKRERREKRGAKGH